MGNLIFLLAFLLPSFALAQDVNLIKNSDFEARLSRWSKTGSSTLAVQSALPLEGDYSADWDASATGEFLRSNTYTVQEGMKGRRCTIEMTYLWDSGTSGHIKMNVDDGASDIATIDVVPTSGGVSGRASQTFDCPTSGSLRFELESTADAASIRVDKVYLGSGKNTVQISQSGQAGESTWPETSGCLWSRANVAAGEFAAVAACPGPTVTLGRIGQWLTTDTDKPHQIINNLPPGNYKATFTFQSVTSPTAISFFTINDGTTECYRSSGEHSSTASSQVIATCTFVYNTPQPSRTFKLFGGSASGSVIVGNTTNGATTRFQLDYTPLSNAEALTLETSGWLVDANIVSSTNASLGASNVTSYTEIIDANSTLTNNSITGAIPAQIACSATNPSTGTTCAAGSESIGLAFNVPYSGPVEACIAFTHSYSFNVVSQSVTAAFQIVETPNNAQTILQQGNERISSNGYASVTGSTNFSQPFRVCSTLNLTAGLKTLRLMYEQSIAGAVPANNIAMDGAVNIGQRDVKWTIKPLNQQMPAPVFTELQNLMKAGGTGYKTLTAFITNAGTPTVTREDGDWIASLTDNGLGDTTINFTGGTFSQTPNCTCSAYTTPGGSVVCNIDKETLSTSSLVRVQTTTVTPTGFDSDFYITCTGPQ